MVKGTGPIGTVMNAQTAIRQTESAQRVIDLVRERVMRILSLYL
jgi:hypothetical protein